MMKRIVFAVIAVAALASVAHGAEQSKYLLAAPSAATNRVDYLILSGDRFAGSLDALAAHRAKQGYAVGIATASAVGAKFKSIADFLAHAATKWQGAAPSFLLLVGDVDSVPAVVKPGRLKGWMSDRDLATDFDYARPAGARTALHVGRFPCDTADELAVMIRKTLDYETRLAGGEWQHRLSFVASVGGYSKQIDGVLEALGMMVASSSVPAAYDIRAAYANPDSPFCPYPPGFNAHAVEMFNAGSLLYLFVGHGSTQGVASIAWRGRSYPIFGADDAKALKARAGLPILVVVACHTGRYDADDCLGETYLKAEGGPVAFIGGSRVTQPYGNGLFAKALVDAFFGQAKTLGEVTTRAKIDVLKNPFSLFRMQADALGSMMQGKETLEPMRQDVVEHYNLLGDPALVIRRPTPDIKVAVNGTTVEVEAPGRDKIELTLECGRLVFRHALARIDENDAQFEAKITDRYAKAHDKLIRRWTVPLKDGRGAVEFERPAAPGRYFFKAAAGSSVGSAQIDVEPPAPAPAGR